MKPDEPFCVGERAPEPASQLRHPGDTESRPIGPRSLASQQGDLPFCRHVSAREDAYLEQREMARDLVELGFLQQVFEIPFCCCVSMASS